VEATKGPKVTNEVISESQFDEKMKVAYPMAEEELIDFFNSCRLKNYEVMLHPKCSFVFDKGATKGLEGFIPKSKKRGKWSADHIPKFPFTKRYIPFTKMVCLVASVFLPVARLVLVDVRSCQR